LRRRPFIFTLAAKYRYGFISLSFSFFFLEGGGVFFFLLHWSRREQSYETDEARIYLDELKNSTGMYKK
jgi:hypothetical protein